MKGYWYFFFAAILCAIFSKQIDNFVARAIEDNKKRAVLYCIIGAVMLALIGLLIYQTLSGIIESGYIIIFSILPLFLFGMGIVLVRYFGKNRRSK